MNEEYNFNNQQNQQNQQERPRIAIITNHGYAGVEIPVGGAPDTGGQNFYVNSLAKALDELGMDVTIFARGGFPFFGSNKVRKGIEQYTPHVRYVYVPGGGDTFIRKEDIAVALDEEAVWIHRFIQNEANKAHVAPWDYFECINSHYWDAAIIGMQLIEYWQDDIAFDFLKSANDGLFEEHMAHFEGTNKYKHSLSREIHKHLGVMSQSVYPEYEFEKIAQEITESDERLKDKFEPGLETAQSYRKIESTIFLGSFIYDNLKVGEQKLSELLPSCNRHVWTPHSLGIIKERNFWEKDKKSIRTLKFRERNSHELTLCQRVPLFCVTSPEIWTAMCSYYNCPAEHIFDFPPCIDTEQFKPRKDDELIKAWEYLSDNSGIPVDVLKKGRIVFESSRMDRTKRKDLLLKAFSPIANWTDDTYLFIGGGPTTSAVYKNLKKLKNELPGLEGRAFLLGFIPEEVLEPLFAIPTVFASASEMEGFGMSISQAAAAKIAVVSSNLIPFATQYAPNASVIVQAGDINGFTIAIMNLLKNEKEREQRATALYDIAQELNWNTSAEHFIQWYRKHFNKDQS